MVSVGSSPQLRIENQPGHSSGAFFSRKMCVWGQQGFFWGIVLSWGLRSTQKTQKRRPASFGIWRNPQFRIANYTGRGLVRINRGSVSGRGVSQVLRLVTSRGLRMQQMLCFQKWGERIGFHLVSNPKHIVPHLEIKLFRSVLSLWILGKTLSLCWIILFPGVWSNRRPFTVIESEDGSVTVHFGSGSSVSLTLFIAIGSNNIRLLQTCDGFNMRTVHGKVLLFIILKASLYGTYVCAFKPKFAVSVCARDGHADADRMPIRNMRRINRAIFDICRIWRDIRINAHRQIYPHGPSMSH